jgi:predicted extracellular nuclease
MRRKLMTVFVVATAAIAAAATPALATSPDVVISEVYGGGGNSGAPWRNDYVELYNRSAAAVSLSGWSVQYASAAGTNWLITNLTGSIAPGGFYLVQLGSGGSAGNPLPTPDSTGTTNMSATSGKVALHNATTTRDLVGYGSANQSEGSPAPAGSNTTSVARINPAVDTDNNAADFAVGTPTPQNSSGGGGSCPATPTRIRDIQGAAHTSPLAGSSRSTRGIVTAVSTNGFWIQDPCPDTNAATSEGVFVYTASAPTVVAGDDVDVTGTVSEFRSGGASSTNLTTTELTSPSVTRRASGQPLPAATIVGSGGRVPPGTVIEDDASGSVETSGTFDPTTDGIDFWESLEGMRVQIANPVVVGPRSSFGEIPVIPGGSGVRTNRGGIVVQANDFNPERVLLDDVLAPTPTANVGDTFSGALVGVLDYSFGNFKLLPSTAPSIVSGGLAQESTAAQGAGQLAIATFNVENLDPTDPQSKFDGLAAVVVNNLRSPDLVALEEVQDNDGPANNGVVAANQTMAKLIAAITAAGGPSYTYRQINPTDGADGGEPGGNIRCVFMYRTDRGLSFVDRPGGTATLNSAVLNVGGVPQLQYSPGRIQPTNSAFNASRKPLAGEFRWNGRTVYVVANHFNSKGGDNPLFGRYQPPVRSSETQRHQQATIVNTFVDQVRAIDANAAIVVLGDLNDYEFSQTTSLLTGSGELVDLPATLPLAERYTYVFEGNSQVLDHILLSAWLATQPFAYDVVHVNSEFATQVSDHEPQVVRLTL